MAERNLCVKVALETDISSLKQFSATQSLDSRVGLTRILEILEKHVLDGDVYVDKLPDMSTVIIVIPPTGDRRNGLDTRIKLFSTEKDVSTRMLLSLPSINFTSDQLVLVGSVLLTEHFYNAIAPRLGGKVQSLFKAYTYLLTVPSQKTQNLPRGYRLVKIKDDDYEFIRSCWPYTRGPDDAKWFRFIAQNFESVAVYTDSESSEVVAWVFERTEGNLLHLFTLPEHRNKGLGLFVIQEISKRLQEKGRTPMTFIANGNTASEKLFTKAGFTRIGPLREWICFNL